MDKILTSIISTSMGEFLKKNSGAKIILVGITPDQFVDRLCDAMAANINKLIAEKVNMRAELTRNEAASFLNISAATLDNYTEKGMFIKYGHGKRARYLLSEVQAAKAKYFPGDLTRKEAADLIGICPVTLDRYVRKGMLTRLGTGKFARFDKREVDAARDAILLSSSKNKRKSRLI